MEKQHATFQQLAVLLISAVKDLQAAASKQVTLSDKDL